MPCSWRITIWHRYCKLDASVSGPPQCMYSVNYWITSNLCHPIKASLSYNYHHHYFHFISFHFISFYFILFYFILFYFILFSLFRLRFDLIFPSTIFFSFRFLQFLGIIYDLNQPLGCVRGKKYYRVHGS